MDRKNLEFASLLHDIGKFYQRTEFKYSRQDLEEYKNLDSDDFKCEHGRWSAEFIKPNFNSIIADLALYHHIPKNSINKKLTEIIQKADHHSSGERIEDEKNKSIYREPMLSIFSRIWINTEKNKKPADYYLPLNEINLKNFEDLMPVKEKGKSLKVNYSILWDKFEEEVKSLKNPFDFRTILTLLQKYASTIPSAVYKSEPDISLYDHSKTTAALAVSRYLYNEKCNDLDTSNSQKVYLVINGDISGIQKFIFKISSPEEAQSGMSKRLRGRSLYLTLLTDAIASRIIKDLDLTEANILFCGGGRFTIIGPNTEDTIEKLKILKDKINKEFIKEFNAELYLAIASSEASGDDLKEFGQITYNLSQKLNEDKKHKFLNNLDDLFDINEPINGKATCSVCGKLYAKKDGAKKNLCESCNKHSLLGQELANANYMLKCHFNEDFKSESDEQNKLLFYSESLNITYKFISYKKSKEGKISLDLTFDSINEFIKKYDSYIENLEIIKLNDSDFLEFENRFNLEQLDKISFSYKFMGNVVPKYSNRYPLYFEHLAKVSRGTDKLGVLKMDVDDLGLIFSTGFNHLKEGKDKSGSSISRISTLSSQLDLFFSGFINNLASKFIVYHNDINKEIGEKLLKSKFDEIRLNLQDEHDKYLIVYKKKFGEELDDEIKAKLQAYEIPTIHINYSGGDDLLVLGPYDDIIEFGKDLRNSFKKWTCDNDSINLSAGINIVSSKFPIGKAVDMAENYLERSKSCGKDKITLFNETVSWNVSQSAGFDELFEFASYLEKCYMAGNNGVSKSFIYSLLHMWQYSYDTNEKLPSNEKEWNKSITYRKGTKKYIPIFKYKLRLIKNQTIRNKLNEKVIQLMPWIRIPVSWVSLRTR